MMFSAGGMSVCFACITGLVSSEKPAALKAAVFFLYVNRLLTSRYKVLTEFAVTFTMLPTHSVRNVIIL